MVLCAASLADAPHPPDRPSLHTRKPRGKGETAFLLVWKRASHALSWYWYSRNGSAF